MMSFESQYVHLGIGRHPQDETIQSIKEERRYVTRKEDCWMVYTSKEVGDRWDLLGPVAFQLPQL